MASIPVAPLVGAWIEIDRHFWCPAVDVVAPLVGAWIEIIFGILPASSTTIVAPLVGAWIEIRRYTKVIYTVPSLLL